MRPLALHTKQALEMFVTLTVLYLKMQLLCLTFLTAQPDRANLQIYSGKAETLIKEEAIYIKTVLP
jgi:hypothetical protein